jgi:hypothetical protein
MLPDENPDPNLDPFAVTLVVTPTGKRGTKERPQHAAMTANSLVFGES